MQIDQFAIFRERLEAVREPLRDEQASAVLRGEDGPVPMQKSGRVAPQVNRHIEYLAVQATDQFDLSVRGILEMHPAHTPLCSGQRVIHLRDRLVHAGFPELIRAEEPRQESALVLDRFALHQLQSGQRGGDEIESHHR